MTNVRKILCHAEFRCDRCAKPYLCMGIVSIDPQVLRINGDAERIGHNICNSCQADDREQEKRNYKTYRQQLKWRKKKKFDHLLNGPNGGA